MLMKETLLHGAGLDLQASWPAHIPDEQWETYRKIIRLAKDRRLHFSLGGAFAMAAYTSRWRNSKDMDIYVQPADRDAMVEVLTAAGLDDFYERLPYDRGWIYRGCRGDVIVDVIWAMANRRAHVDSTWIEEGPLVKVRQEWVRVVPPEEMIWAKLYVLQRDRCDWTDDLNFLHAVGPTLNWNHLFDRLGDDAPLLGGLLMIFAWLSPRRARELPPWLWERLRMPGPPRQGSDEQEAGRARLLDSRPWYYAQQEAEAA